MSAYATYVASAGLLTDHIAGRQYNITFTISELVPPAGRALSVRQKSISGKMEGQYYGEERIWDVKTQPYERSSAAAKQLREFLRSTADYQTFVFSPYGSTVVSVQREDGGYTEPVFVAIDGANDLVQYGFQLREV